MSYRKTIVLKDGNTVSIQPLTAKDDIRKFQRFINAMVEECAYLIVDKPMTLKEEKTWFYNQILTIKKGDLIYLKVVASGHLIGVVQAQRGMYRNRGNVSLGIALEKQWRGKGLGRLLIEEIIVRIEQKWHPKNIYLHVVSSNQRAKRLYESLGFHIIARLPQWFEYNKKYFDEYILILDKKRYQQDSKQYKC
jgi:ribosomal protein S18 acetylase RimI-like enzyme